MRQTVHGIVPGWTMAGNGFPSNAIQWFASGPLGAYALDTSGHFYQQSSSWSNVHTTTSSSGNGLIYDQKGRMLYCNQSTLGVMTGVNTFNDNFKSFTVTPSSTNPSPMETYEDFVLIGRDNNIALLDQSDALNEQGFTLPANFVVRGIKSNVNGIGVGANFGSRSIFFLWDAYSDRSISPWIWFNSPIQCVTTWGSQWLVITAHDIYITNGYSLDKMPPLPDTVLTDNIFGVNPQGALCVNDTLILANSSYQYFPTRYRGGFWMIDLPGGAWNFIPAQGKTTANVRPGALYQDAFTSSTPNVYSSWVETPLSGTTYHIGQLNTSPSRGTITSETFGTGTDLKAAKEIKLALGSEQRSTTSRVWSVDITAKIANLNRPLWSSAIQSGAQSNLSVLTVDGTSANSNHRAQVGDEVTIQEGSNAGLTRHITAITGEGTTSEQWTLDTALPFATVDGTFLQLQPFKLVKKLSLSNTSNLDDIRFTVKNSTKGRKFVVKLVFDNINGANPEVQSLSLSYDEVRQ